MNNLTTTWQQGKFIDGPRYGHWTKDQKELADRREAHLVRDGLYGNAICECASPQDAEWIAARLNLAAKLEQMTYDYAAGKTDGTEIVKMAEDHLK